MRPQSRGRIQQNPELFTRCFAMDPKDLLRLDRPIVSFRARIMSSTGLGRFHFRILNDGPSDSHLVTDGELKLTLERALFLQIKPGKHFVAHRVCPDLGHDSFLHEIVVVDLRPNHAEGQILMTSDGTGEPRCIDLCSGMGGWSIGAKHAGIRFAVHIEQDRDVAEAGSRVTLTQLVTKEWVRDCSYQTWDNMIQTGVTIIMPFQDDCCWEKISASGVDLVAASLPCPPWSGLTAQQGLRSEAGRLFDDLVEFVSAFQPRMLALENVEGLIMHEHWRHIVGRFNEVGFVVVHESVDKLDAVCPMQRSRASVIFVNTRQIDTFEKCVLNNVPLPQLILQPNPLTAGAIHHEIPAELDPFVNINSEDRKLLQNPQYWPRYWKPGFPLDEHGKVDLRDRLHNPCKPLPCAVAKYGFPTLLHPNGLKDKGLIMKLLNTGGKIRWISPFEHLTAMGWPIATLIPKDVQLTRMIIGNTISPIHALVTLARAVILLPSLASPIKRKQSFFDLVTPLLSVVPKLPRCEVHSDEESLWLQPIVHPESCIVVLPEACEVDRNEDRQDTEAFQTQLDPPTQKDHPSEEVAVIEPPAKRVKVDIPVFAIENSEQIECQPDTIFRDFLLQSSAPTNMVRVNVFDESGDTGDRLYLWKPNALNTPHLLHEITHADGIKHEVLIHDTWITGTVARTCESTHMIDYQDNMLDIQDVYGSWKCSVGIHHAQDVRCVLQQVAPHVEPKWIFQLQLNEKVCRWGTKATSGTLVIVPFKVKKILVVPELVVTITIYCDHFDTVASVMSEHPILRNIKLCPWFHLDLPSHQVIIMEQGDFLLDFPFHCWTLHSEYPATQSMFPVEIPTCYHEASKEGPNNRLNLTIPDPSLVANHRPGKIMCIHPFTGKSSEHPICCVSHVCELLDFLDPPVPSGVNIVAEVNGHRLDVATAVADLDTRQIVRFRHFGLRGGAPTINRVRTELMAHGVPETQAANRAKAVITALGEPAVQDILQTSDPWATMKSNCKEKNLRLVLPQELKLHQQHMRSASRKRSEPDSTSASSEPSSTRSKGKGKGKTNRGGETAGILDYVQHFDNLQFPDEGFADETGESIRYIVKTQVKSDASGVCPMTLNDAQPFLAMRSLSLDPLALLVLGHDSSPCEGITHIVVPITLKPSGTPYLIPATLVQLGDQPVVYSFSGPSAHIESVPSVVIEVSVDKERCDHWCDSFKPLDLVTQCLPLLRDATKILSHWSWTWTNEKHKKCSVNQASRLHGYLRIPEAGITDVLQLSGPQGLSVLVKTPEKKLDSKYSHIPLATEDCDEVKSLVQTIPKSLGFVCMSGKFKIRCLREDYASIRTQLVPKGFIFDSAPVTPDDKLMVLTSPISLSVSMKSLTDAIQDLGWKATVVRPMGATSWLIKTLEDPPGPHLAINETVMSIRPYIADRPKFNGMKLPVVQPIPATSNPWVNYKPLSAHCTEAPVVGPTALRFEDATKEIRENLESKVQQIVDQKMQHIETQMQTMETKTRVFEQQCNQRFTQVENSVNSSIQTLQQKIDHQESNIIGQMRELFATYNKQEPNVAETPKRPRTGDHGNL